jgi:cell division protein FtsI/penicillin-binding protein 2
MNLSHLVFLLICVLAMTGCSQPQPLQQPTTTPSITPTLSQPGVHTIQAPDAESAARAYLQAWEAEDYDTMYILLTSVSKDAISLDEFNQRYRQVMTEGALSHIETFILSSLTQTRTAQVSYRVLLHSVLVGDIQADTMMNLSLEDGIWRVQWDDALIHPQLSGGNRLRMEHSIPSRGNIYDRDGRALVAQTEATALGLFPGRINPDQEDRLLTELARLTGMRSDTIRLMYENFPPGSDWYLPLRAVSAEVYQQREGILAAFGDALVARSARWRYYFDGGVAPHVIGYVSYIQEGQLDQYLRQGYRRDERIGQAGLERWGEPYLSGRRGGSLYVVDPEGLIVTKLGESPAAPAQAIYTTLERDFQMQVQQAIAGFQGAIVVLERDTGRVLAMASSPTFDPNLFEPINFNSSYLLEQVFDPNTNPTFNRATQGQYPLGSVFKIVTMAAALESELYTPTTTYDCQHTFTRLPGITLEDWTLGRGLPPSGMLTLPEGLMRSCNPYFFDIGLEFYERGMVTAISDMARGFGLGQPTGIGQIVEESGRVPDPIDRVNATNLAIGQGDFLTTPLQVANFVAAIGNGGNLLRPQVVERITPPDGEPSLEFEPQVRATLPVSEGNLQALHDAMVSVVANQRGTAWHRFTGLNIPIAGKTGTAEDPPRRPHAWFAGYTFAERENRPDIAVAVVVENVGEGSEYAALIFRRVLEIYFLGAPRAFYWWESQIGVTQTPTPSVTDTPTPIPTQTPTPDATDTPTPQDTPTMTPEPDATSTPED